jgi:hypothetical protein
MRTDAEKEERAIWKLEQGRYTIRKDGMGYLITSPDGAKMALADLAALLALAEVVYERVWTGKEITRSA